MILLIYDQCEINKGTDNMNRREFLTGSAAGTVALLTGITGCRDSQNDATEKHPSVTNQDSKLAGLTLEELRERHRYYLFDDFLPFLEKYVIDNWRNHNNLFHRQTKTIQRRFNIFANSNNFI